MSRALLATPMGASNLDAIINEGTLTIGWVGPALTGFFNPADRDLPLCPLTF